MLATPGVSKCFAIDVAGFYPSDDDADQESREGPAPHHLGHLHNRLLFRSNRIRMAARNHEASLDGVANGGLVRGPANSPRPERQFPLRLWLRLGRPDRHRSFDQFDRAEVLQVAQCSGRRESPVRAELGWGMPTLPHCCATIHSPSYLDGRSQAHPSGPRWAPTGLWLARRPRRAMVSQ